MGLPAFVLMEHAARGVAVLAALLAPDPRTSILVVCGPGNNGGDGYTAARQLASWGRSVTVAAVGPRPRGPEASRAAGLCSNSPVAWMECMSDVVALAAPLASADLVIDALFGVGLDRPLDGLFVEAVERINASRALRLAVDIPSGMDADRGVPLPICVQAHVTATMAAPKLGFASGQPGAAAAGHVVEVDIGLPWALHAPYIEPARRPA